MAKATRHGGASMTAEEFDNAEYVAPRVRRAEVGPMKRAKKGEEKSPGSNSDQSTPTQNQQSQTQSDRDQSRVQETDNRSLGGPEAEDASSVDGSTQGMGRASRRGPRKAAKRTEPQKARVRMIDDEDDF